MSGVTGINIAKVVLPGISVRGIPASHSLIAKSTRRPPPRTAGCHTSQRRDRLAHRVSRWETLARRLEKGALPLSQAPAVTIEIADTLDETHRTGIVHRQGNREPASAYSTLEN